MPGRDKAFEIKDFSFVVSSADDQAVTLTAIALAESGGNSGAHAPHGEDSRGLWQINVDPAQTASELFTFQLDMVSEKAGQALGDSSIDDLAVDPNNPNTEWPIGPIPSLETVTIVHDDYWL